jgi:hypothetical protein
LRDAALCSAGNAARTLADAVVQQARQFQGTQGAPEQQQEQRGVLLRLLRTLDLRYPAALDAALDAVLLVKAAAGDEVNAPAGSDGQQHVLALLSEAFEGTARSQLLEAGTTVLLAAEAPAASMRQLVSVKLLSSVPHLLAQRITGWQCWSCWMLTDADACFPLHLRRQSSAWTPC